MSALQRETLAFKNPNKEWVVKELDALICEWRAWQEEVEQLGEDPRDPFDPKPGRILADGEENIKKHRILQAKTLEFVENNIAGHGFITGRDGANVDRTDLRLKFRVKHRLDDLDELRACLEYAENTTQNAGSPVSTPAKALEESQKMRPTGKKVFIGHGRSLVWRELEVFLEKRLHLSVEEFNSVSVAGIPTAIRLEQMLDTATFAFLVMTAEDETSDGKLHARLNVVHEAGLFQGKLGFKKAIILLEDGCEDFSNIDGLGHIGFPKGQIAPKFEEIRQVLEREEALSPFPAALVGRAPRIDILFEKRVPYEVTEIQHGRVLSTIRVGIVNGGKTPLSNCKVYIDKISPEPSLPGGLPILLEGEGFTLRHDDPEKIVDVAAHWDHVDKYRFSTPVGSGFSDAVSFIDDKILRTIVIRVEARECQRNASFRIWTDDLRVIHLEYVGYVD